MKKNLVVFTVAMGGDYDLPRTIPQDGIDYICFTDQLKIEPNGWTIRRVDPIILSDTYRSSREHKLRPHRWLVDYERSIYIDSSVQLRGNPNDLWNYLIPSNGTVFGGFIHSFRTSIADEFTAVAEGRLDYQAKINEQRLAYIEYYPKIMHSRPIWGGLLARRHNSPACIDAMELWFAHVMRYSRRDQLSLRVALKELYHSQGNIVGADIKASDFHEWPVSKRPKPPGYTVDDSNYTKNITENMPTHHTRAESKEAKSLTDTLHEYRRSLKKRGRMLRKWIAQRRVTHMKEVKNEIQVEVPSSINLEKNLSTLPNEFVSYGYNETLKLHFAQELNSNKLVYVSDEERLSLYQEGIAHCRNWILSDYRLPVDLIGKDDVVIDIGANIGELGLWVTERGGRYIAFEPDPRAYWALENNIPNGELHRLALSDKVGVAEFYLSTANADSSLFKPLIVDEVLSVETSTLDAFFENTNKPSKIRLLKVEAEGMEPEILSGALKTLESVEYVAVDAGPERGGDNTVPGVFSVLVDANFEVIDSFLLRGTFLFRRRNLIDH